LLARLRLNSKCQLKNIDGNVFIDIRLFIILKIRRLLCQQTIRVEVKTTSPGEVLPRWIQKRKGKLPVKAEKLRMLLVMHMNLRLKKPVRQVVKAVRLKEVAGKMLVINAQSLVIPDRKS